MLPAETVLSSSALLPQVLRRPSASPSVRPSLCLCPSVRPSACLCVPRPVRANRKSAAEMKSIDWLSTWVVCVAANNLGEVGCIRAGEPRATASEGD